MVRARVEAHSARSIREILFNTSRYTLNTFKRQIIKQKDTMRVIVVLVAVLGLSAAVPVFINDGVAQYNPTPYAHEAVLTNSAMEAMLPSELRNHFYDNPHTAAALAQQSWLGYKEMQVIDREADKIPREKIFHVLQNAGLTR